MVPANVAPRQRPANGYDLVALDTATALRAPPAAQGGIDELVALAAGDMARVNALITERMASHVPVIPALADHLIAAGGKRLRPLLAVAASRLVGGQGEEGARLAAAVEFIHTATLLHDDVVDVSNLRRGKV